MKADTEKAAELAAAEAAEVHVITPLSATPSESLLLHSDVKLLAQASTM